MNRGCNIISAIDRAVPLEHHHTVLEPTVACLRPKLPVDLLSVKVTKLVKRVYHVLIPMVVDVRMPLLVELCPGEDDTTAVMGVQVADDSALKCCGHVFSHLEAHDPVGTWERERDGEVKPGDETVRVLFDVPCTVVRRPEQIGILTAQPVPVLADASPEVIDRRLPRQTKACTVILICFL